MVGLSGKIVEVHASAGSETFAVGKRLRTLRELSGVSACELAEKLCLTGPKLAGLERSTDIPISVVKKYVEALGATFQLNAAFAANSTVAFRIADAFGYVTEDDSQLILPIFGDDNPRSQRDIILSIRPKYSSQILNGAKTIELRRRFPVNIPSGTIAYIYSTTPEKAVVGYAEIQSVKKERITNIWRSYKHDACIAKVDFDEYFKGQTFGFALQLRLARAFAKPIDLDNLRKQFGFEPPQSFLYAKPQISEALRNEPPKLSY